METPLACGRDDGIAGLVIADDAGRLFAIGWDDLQPFRVPAAWAAAVAALVRGEEPVDGGEDMRGQAAAGALTDRHVLLIEAVAAMRGPRLAAQRPEAWALLG